MGQTPYSAHTPSYEEARRASYTWTPPEPLEWFERHPTIATVVITTILAVYGVVGVIIYRWLT